MYYNYVNVSDGLTSSGDVRGIEHNTSDFGIMECMNAFCRQ